MSETESHVGKLKRVDLQGKTIEQWCEELCSENFLIKDTYEDTYKEVVVDRLHEQYFFTATNVYRIIEHADIEDDEIYIMNKIDDDTYSFTMRFYNGGTCLSECIEDELEKLEKQTNEN